MWTVSATAGDYIVYDENLSAGLVGLSEDPGALADIQVSHLKTKVESPKDKADAVNKALEATYDAYIDVKPTKDYLGGAYLRYEISSPFVFNGNCASEANTCVPSGATGYDATCVNTTLDTGSCAQDGTTGNWVFEHKGALYKNKWYRIKIGVKNPSFYGSTTGGSIDVWMYSRKANVYYYYEKKTDLSNVFEITKLSIDKLTILLFWGLSKSEGPSWGCPISIYKDAGTAALVIWNKVTVHFKVKTAFPSVAEAYYKLEVNTNHATKLALSSINSNLPKKVSSKKLDCKFGVTTEATKSVFCFNVGAASAKSYWFAFSFNMKNGGTAPTALGALKFSQGKSTTTNNVVSAPAENAYTECTNEASGYGFTPVVNDEFLGKYLDDTGTEVKLKIGDAQVVNFVEPTAAVLEANYNTEINKYVGGTADVAGTSAIRLSSTGGAISLLFLIDPTSD